MSNKITFKKPLTLDEQVEYIRDNKNVVISDTIEMNKEKAKHFLYLHNYINVITPFKYNYCKKNNEGKPFTTNNKHIYPNTIDFTEYYKKYNEEREMYPILYKKISELESRFNAILSYEVMHHYNIIDLNHFDAFISDLKFNLCKEYELRRTVNKFYRYDNIRKAIDDFKYQLEDYCNIYVFFDRLSTSDLLNTFICLDPNLKKKIFNSLIQEKLNLNIPDIPTFEDTFFKVVSIRNCICHSNSLEILIRFYNIKIKDPRNKSDIQKYYTTINKLLELELID